MQSTLRKVALVSAAALAVAGLSVADYLAWRASHHRLLDLAEQSGLSRRLPEVPHQLRREMVPARAATYVAWSLLELEVDRGWLAELPAEERSQEADRGLERLQLARRLAEETLPARPASWQMATVLGASRYLEAERQRHTMPSTSAWQVPLDAAMRLAPGHADPPLFLASAYLSRWSSLSPGERDAAVPVLARAFAGRRGLDLLLPTWVRLAPSLSRLLEPIPDRVEGWRRLGEEFLRIGDIERFAIARGRWLDSLADFLAERVESARARKRGGDRGSAAAMLRSVIAAPHDLAFVDSFSAAVAEMPETGADRRTPGHLHRWLLWALDLCVLDRCPLDAGTLALLAGRIDGPSTVELALTAIANDDASGARGHEPAVGVPREPQWNRYWIFKAFRLAERQPEEAQHALDRAAPLPGDELRYWHATARLAEIAGDANALSRAREKLTGLAHYGESAPAWTGRGRLLRLELLVPEPASGLRLGFAGIRPEGAAVELRWDGRSMGVAGLQAGEPHLWRFPIEPGLHLVEVENLAGRPPRPTALRLKPAALPVG